jgi:RNA polymerase subunit RPABC4/transcription elongation factor Spt4
MPLDNNLLLLLAIYAGVVLLAFWLAMVVWAYRDMRARSRDRLAGFFVAAVVAILNVPGLFIYILMRPRETLSEAYERSLEEEALLQEIEEKPTCPGCGHRVQDDWQACPYCHTRLKKPCRSCTNLLELSWNLCPYCAADQSRYEPAEAAKSGRHVQRTLQPTQPPSQPSYPPEVPPNFPDKWMASGNNPQRDNPQYIDEEY